MEDTGAGTQLPQLTHSFEGACWTHTQVSLVPAEVGHSRLFEGDLGEHQADEDEKEIALS